MLLTTTDTPAKIWQALVHELHRGALDPKHPFRYLTLATEGKHFPQLRTVVLRKLSPSLDFHVFTDARSGKVKELLETPRASLLFYHPKKQVQVRIKSTVSFHSEDELAKGCWAQLPEHRQSEYRSSLAPGTPIGSPQEGWEETETQNFFSVLKFSPLSIDLLQLSKEGHLRLQFDLTSNWKGTWLTP
jgi:pyridoxamine 5'-phosphate oxidase